MPKRKEPAPDEAPKNILPTTEAISWLQGLADECAEQVHRYHELTASLFSLQARVELVEKNLCVTRDHLAMQIGKAEEPVPDEWSQMLTRARFVGTRLADSCIALLQEHKRMTHIEMLNALNMGMFRFRTQSPLREIHGALLRQPYVKRASDGWIWNGPEIGEGPPAPPTPGPTGLRLILKEAKATTNGGATTDR